MYYMPEIFVLVNPREYFVYVKASFRGCNGNLHITPIISSMWHVRFKESVILPNCLTIDMFFVRIKDI